MSCAARPARCLFARASRLAADTSTPSALRRSFHASPAHTKRSRPHYPSIKAADLEKLNERAAAEFPAYSESEKELLRAKYTPEQLAVIEAGEAAIDPRDLLTQSRSRDGEYMALRYRDDLRKLQPVMDKQPKAELDPYADYGVRPKTDDEMALDLAQFHIDEGERLEALNLPPGSDAEAEEAERSRVRYLRFMDSPRTFMHADSEEGYRSLEDEAFSTLAPELPKIDGLVPRSGGDETAADDALLRLSQQTGLPPADIRYLRVKNLVTHRVVNQTRLGKISSYYFLTIAGNGNGMLGVGEGKSAEGEDGRRQAMADAVRNMKPIARYEGRTIYGEVDGKVGAVELKLSSRPPGFGLRCQHLIFEMARAAGIHDLAAHVTRSRNKMNVVKATWQALLGQKLPEDIARARGRKLVDVRKVYYGGAVH